MELQLLKRRLFWDGAVYPIKGNETNCLSCKATLADEEYFRKVKANTFPKGNKKVGNGFHFHALELYSIHLSVS